MTVDHVLCVNCEKQDPRQGSTHLAEHILIKIVRGKRETAADDDLAGQDGFNGESAKIVTIEERLKDLEERFSGMERLLSRIAEKLGLD